MFSKLILSNKVICSFILSVVIRFTIQAQPCQQYPADCPDLGSIEAASDKQGCLNNLMIIEEINLQDKLRELIIAMMQQVAKSNNWQVYEYSETSGDGIAISGTSNPLPYQFRGPHAYIMSFIFIVNEDSLAAWRYWKNNELAASAESVVQSYNQAAFNQPDNNESEKHFDSANYYAIQMTEFMNKHTSDHQSDLLSNNQKSLKAYDDQINGFTEKINHFIAKSNRQREKQFSNADTQRETMLQTKHIKTIAFRNASMIRVKIIINQGLAGPTSSNDFKITNKLLLPGSALAISIHNNQPDEGEIYDLDQFTRSPDLAFILFGKWQPKPDAYNLYHAMYTLDKKNTDGESVKKVPCDKVQTIVLHVEGSTNYTHQFLQTLDIHRLNILVEME
jgi:hypothetical protein